MYDDIDEEQYQTALIQQVYAWNEIAKHPFFKDCYEDYSVSLLEAMLRKLDRAYEGA